MAAVMIFAAACKNGGGENEVNKVPAIDLANLDTTIAPGSDFYAYATAGWQRNHPKKPEYSRNTPARARRHSVPYFFLPNLSES